MEKRKVTEAKRKKIVEVYNKNVDAVTTLLALSDDISDKNALLEVALLNEILKYFEDDDVVIPFSVQKVKNINGELKLILHERFLIEQIGGKIIGGMLHKGLDVDALTAEDWHKIKKVPYSEIFKMKNDIYYDPNLVEVLSNGVVDTELWQGKFLTSKKAPIWRKVELYDALLRCKGFNPVFSNCYSSHKYFYTTEFKELNEAYSSTLLQFLFKSLIDSGTFEDLNYIEKLQRNDILDFSGVVINKKTAPTLYKEAGARNEDLPEIFKGASYANNPEPLKRREILNLFKEDIFILTVDGFMKDMLNINFELTKEFIDELASIVIDNASTIESVLTASAESYDCFREDIAEILLKKIKEDDPNKEELKKAISSFLEKTDLKQIENINAKVYGIYPGKGTDTEKIENLSEVDLYFEIEELDNFICGLKLDVDDEDTDKSYLTELEYAYDYLVYQTRKFGVDIPDAKSDERVVETDSFCAWFNFYKNHFKNELTEKEKFDFMKKKVAGEDISEYLPKGNWKDSLEEEKKRERRKK